MSKSGKESKEDDKYPLNLIHWLRFKHIYTSEKSGNKRILTLKFASFIKQ